jgi:Ca2+-binding RTX toxin-like protein
MSKNYEDCDSVGETLIGSAASDFLFGSRGDDILRGLDGNDWVFGLRGSDQIIAGDGDDRALGGKGADTIDAGDGNDVVLGQGGNDVVEGGFGVDLLSGGKGEDTYAFGQFFLIDPEASPVSVGVPDTGVGEAADIIIDFEGAGQEGGDVIDLSAIQIVARFFATDTSFRFIGTDAFAGPFAQVRYEIEDGYTVIQLDGARSIENPLVGFQGDGVPDAEIIVLGEHHFVAKDFVL